ncbi:MAG: adenylate kinase [Sulfolobales archaeon]
MLKTLIVVGVAGVGKSTVLSIATKELVARGYSVRVVNFGDLMFETLKQRGLVRSRDDIRNLPLSIQREVQKDVAEKISNELSRIRALGGEGVYVFIIDTHAVVKTSTGYWSGLPSFVVTRLSPDSIVIIEADVDEIIGRHARDVERRRSDYSDPGLLRELLMLNRVFAISSANLVGASVYIIHNKEGKAEEAASELVNLVVNLKG